MTALASELEGLTAQLGGGLGAIVGATAHKLRTLELDPRWDAASGDKATDETSVGALQACFEMIFEELKQPGAAQQLITLNAEGVNSAYKAGVEAAAVVVAWRDSS